MRQPQEQRWIHQRILRAWLKVPELRLAQLIANTFEDESIFYVEDEVLASEIEEFVKKHSNPHVHNHLPLGMAIPADGPEDP